MSGQLYDVFLSYKSEDRVWVTELHRALHEQRGARVWQDGFEIRAGDEFPQALLDGIDSSKAVVMVISPVTRRSGWAEFEYRRAKAREGAGQLQIIPIILSGAELPDDMKLLQHIDFSDRREFECRVDRVIWPGATGKHIKILPIAQSPNAAWNRLQELGHREGLTFLPLGNLSRVETQVNLYLADVAHRFDSRLVVMLDPFDGSKRPQEYVDFVFDVRKRTKDTSHEVVFVLYPPEEHWQQLNHGLNSTTVDRLTGYFSIPQDSTDDAVMQAKIRAVWNQAQSDLMRGERL